LRPPPLIRISTTDDRAKVRNLRREPRASFPVSSPDFWTYAVAEGIADLSLRAGQVVLTRASMPAARR
jgi:hypothetical protein